MTIQSVGRFRRLSKDLEGACVDFMEDLRGVWGNDQEAINALREMREVLSGIDATLNLLEVGLNRLEEIRIRDRRKHLQLVKGHGKGAKAL
jgi:hypothetical protein